MVSDTHHESDDGCSADGPVDGACLPRPSALGPRPCPVHAHRFTIALHDTDAAGVLFFAHLFRHAHDAYEGLMAAIGWPLAPMIANGALALPLVHAEADYRRPMRHGDALCCTVTVADIAQRRFTLDYRFTDAAGQDSATARTVHAAIAPDSGQATALPEALAEALRGAPAGP